MNIWVLIITIALLAGNAFMIAAEVSLAAANRSKIDEMANKGIRSAKVASSLMRDLRLVVSGCQLGITVFSFVLGYVAERALAEYIAQLPGLSSLPTETSHAIAFPLTLLLITYLHVVLGEMVPKNAAITTPERVAMLVAVPYRAYATVTGWLLWLPTLLAKPVLRIFGVQPGDEVVAAYSESEISLVLEDLREEGSIDPSTERLVGKSLEFGRKRVKEVMVPRLEMHTLSISSTVQDLQEAFTSWHVSRIPLFDSEEDDLVGFVHAIDLLSIEESKLEHPLPAEKLRSLLVLPESARIAGLPQTMQKDKAQMVIAVDEHGSVTGLLTIEDLAEELVGEIADEHESPQLRIHKLASDQYLVSGLTRLDELAEATGIQLDEGSYETVAGYVLDLIGRIPELNEIVDTPTAELTARRLDGPRIVEIEARKKEITKDDPKAYVE
tara:strand:+ start:279 stop:1601 length:1323 start_codon:yes stop_codon:yes gene_type:complete